VNHHFTSMSFKAAIIALIPALLATAAAQSCTDILTIAEPECMDVLPCNQMLAAICGQDLEKKATVIDATVTLVGASTLFGLPSNPDSCFGQFLEDLAQNFIAGSDYKALTRQCAVDSEVSQPVCPFIYTGRSMSSTGALCITNTCATDDVFSAFLDATIPEVIKLNGFIYNDDEDTITGPLYVSCECYNNVLGDVLESTAAPDLSTIFCDGESVTCNNVNMIDFELSTGATISQPLCTDGCDIEQDLELVLNLSRSRVKHEQFGRGDAYCMDWSMEENSKATLVGATLSTDKFDSVESCTVEALDERKGFCQDSCTDNVWADFNFDLDSNGKKVSCGWLTKNDKKSARRKERYCSRVPIAEACPVTCDTSCPCEDDPDHTFVLNHNGSTGGSCEWITKNKKEEKITKRRAEYCGIPEIGRKCVKACEYCAV